MMLLDNDRLVMECNAQGMPRAEGTLQAKLGLVDPDRIEGQGGIIECQPSAAGSDRAIALFKSIWVGLGDVGLARLALRRLQATSNADRCFKRAAERRA